ncbi:unnamed protein product [Closterium sp. NIES-54]
MTHLWMGEQESAMDYCNRARQILAEMRMAGAEYSTASYITHVIKGLLRKYNVMKRMMMVPGMRESLHVDSLTSYVIKDEALQEAEYGGGRSMKDVDQAKSARDKGRGGGGQQWECWICHDPEHLSYECPECDDSDEDDNKIGCGRATNRRPRRDEKPLKENQMLKKTSSTKGVVSSSGKGRSDGEALCSMVGVVEPTVSLVPEAGMDFQVVAAAVQANPMAVLLDSGCSHHLMGTKAVFVDMAPSGSVKHLVQHTFSDKGLDAKEAQAVVHIDLCRPFGVAAKDGSMYFLLLKHRHTRFVRAVSVAKKSDMLREFEKWLVLVERQTKKSVLMLRSDRGGEFLRTEFTNFVDGKGIVHDLTCSDTQQQNGMAEWEMRTVVESVRMMLPHMGVQHHWWHLALQQAVWVLGAVDDAAGDDGAPAANWEEARPHAGVSVGLRGAVHGSRAAAWWEANVEGSLGASPVCVVEKQGLGSAGIDRQQGIYIARPAFTKANNDVDDDPLYNNVGDDDEQPKLDPNVHADPEHRWDIATMTVKEALASWKGEVNWWVLTSKYRIDDTIVREKARLVVKGFTQVYGADYEETYSPVSSYVRLRIFLSIVVVLDLNLVQLDMKNAVLHSKLDRVLYMYQPEYFDDGTGRVCKLLKSLYWLNYLPLLWYKALDVTCWVLVFVDDLLTTSSSTAMLKELKELLEAAFELREISPVIKYLGLEIVRDRPTRQHQQNSCADLTFDDDEAQEREEEDYRQKFGSLQFAATTTRLDIAFACSKLGSGLTSPEQVGYVDVDNAGEKQNRTSTGGYVFFYGWAVVFWSSSGIKCATFSSTESEYVAATDIGK